MDVIKVIDAVKSFKGNMVLDHVSLTCEEGKIYGLVGYNGSGKTVLFKCICGFYHLDEGEILIHGEKSTGMLTEAGIIIEEPAFLRNCSGYRNLELLYMLRNKRDKQHLYRVMNRVGLNPKSRKHVCNYSLGMKQRLALAQAIMEDPHILILDEPMNGLDKRGVSDMRALFEELRSQGKTLIMASHNKEDIEILCDEVYEIDRGKMVRLR